MNQPYQPWWLALVSIEPTALPQTAIADAMLRALERAFFNPKHPLRKQFFDPAETDKRSIGHGRAHAR
jgi:hypothetical protein